MTGPEYSTDHLTVAVGATTAAAMVSTLDGLREQLADLVAQFRIARGVGADHYQAVAAVMQGLAPFYTRPHALAGVLAVACEALAETDWPALPVREVDG